MGSEIQGMKMKAKVMNLMPLEGFGVKKSWGVMGG